MAVGFSAENALVMTTSDGRAWQIVPAQDSLKSGTMKAVATIGSHLVAVGTTYERALDAATASAARSMQESIRNWGARSWVSGDGITWARSPDDPGLALTDMWSVASNGSTIVAIGAISGPPCVNGAHPPCSLNPDSQEFGRPAIWSSSDGLHWTKAHTPALDPSQQWTLANVASDGSRFVAVGASDSFGSTAQPLIWVSDDGQSWSPVPAARDLQGARFVSMAHGPIGFVAVGTLGERPGGLGGPRPTIWLSKDGMRWTEVAYPEAGSTADLVGVISTDTGYLAWTSSPSLFPADLQLWTSTDGRSWAGTFEIEYPGFADWYAATAWSGGAVIAGVTWTADISDPRYDATVWII